MAIATTINLKTVMGNKRVVCGTSVLSGTVATGEVVTGLARVDHFMMNVAGATQKGCSVDETFPLASGTVTAVTESNDQTFHWMAIGN